MIKIIFISFLLVSLNVYGFNPTKVIEGVFIYEIIWAPNGEMMIVKPNYDSPYLVYKKKNIWNVKSLGLSMYSKFFVWSNKSDKFIFWNEGNLYIQQIGDKPVLFCKASESKASWSPDDKWISYSYNDNIWIMQFNNKQKIKITKRSIKGASYPQWKNLKTIIFYGDKPKQGSTIWKVDLNTGSPKMISNKIDCYYSGWSIGSSGIPIIDIESLDIKLLSYNGKVNNLTTNGNGIDGKVFVRYSNGSLFYLDNYRNLVHVKNKKNRVLMSKVDRASISPDGKYLAYTSNKEFYITNLSE